MDFASTTSKGVPTDANVGFMIFLIAWPCPSACLSRAIQSNRRGPVAIARQ